MPRTLPPEYERRHGLRKSPWWEAPEIARDIPTSNANKMRGSLTWRIAVCKTGEELCGNDGTILAISMPIMSPGEAWYLPINKERTARAIGTTTSRMIMPRFGFFI